MSEALATNVGQVPTMTGQPIYPLDPAKDVARASAMGLVLLRQIAAPSAQPGNAAASIHWTWIVLEKAAPA